MDRVYEIAAGIDVHQGNVVVSVRRIRDSKEVVTTRTFETFHDGLRAMAEWLGAEQVEVVGLESTGVYWHPVVRVVQTMLPAAAIWLVNPAHVKKVPGRKTDVTDSQWLAKLAMYGLLSPSFLAPAAMQELRKLTRHRTKLTADQTRHKNRILKEMESSGIKIAIVCSDVFGKTGRALLDAMVAGAVLDEAQIACLARGSLRDKVPLLVRAVQGPLTPGTVVILRQLLRRFDDLAQDISDLESEIRQRMQPMNAELQRLMQIPGVDEVAGAAILAEIGPDMSVFPSAKHLSSWAGLSPGSEESAGKSKKAPTRKGNKYLRTILVQVAMCAKKTKGTFWQRKFWRLARLGPKKAAVALARSLLSVIFHMLADATDYREPDTIPLPPHRLRAQVAKLTNQLKALGYRVDLTEAPQTVS
jgi:transposase